MINFIIIIPLCANKVNCAAFWSKVKILDRIGQFALPSLWTNISGTVKPMG